MNETTSGRVLGSVIAALKDARLLIRDRADTLHWNAREMNEGRRAHFQSLVDAYEVQAETARGLSRQLDSFDAASFASCGTEIEGVSLCLDGVIEFIENEANARRADANRLPEGALKTASLTAAEELNEARRMVVAFRIRRIAEIARGALSPLPAYEVVERMREAAYRERQAREARRVTRRPRAARS